MTALKKSLLKDNDYITFTFPPPPTITLNTGLRLKLFIYVFLDHKFTVTKLM